MTGHAGRQFDFPAPKFSDQVFAGVGFGRCPNVVETEAVSGNRFAYLRIEAAVQHQRRTAMAGGILLWLLGIPIPIIILLILLL